MVDERGEACLIDPVVYHGHREVELAVPQLFDSTYFHQAKHIF